MSLSGKKTYLCVAAILGYLAGIHLGLWQRNAELDLLLFALVAAAIRSAIASINPPPPTNP